MVRPDESPLSPPARALGPPPNAGEHMSAVSHAESATSPARPKAARAPCEARHTSEKLPLNQQ